MRIGIVTTFSDKGYEEYGHWFVESAKRFIDKDISLFFYTDNIKLNLPSNSFDARTHSGANALQ